MLETIPNRHEWETEMEHSAPSIIDLNAEVSKLMMFRRTPRSTREETKGSVARLADYRDGLLLAIKASGKDHWERHLAGDELIHILDGTKILEIVCDAGPPKSFELRAGTIVVIPQGVWHRSYSEGTTTISAVPFPGETIVDDVDDPRTIESKPIITTTPPSIVDARTELAKLTMFRGRTPASTISDRKGSTIRLAAYRDGAILASKWAGKGHWEIHRGGDELVHIVEGAATLEILGDSGPQSFELHAEMLAVNPQGTWHRFRSPEGVMMITATPFPSEVIEVDVDDPRTIQKGTEQR
jgi:mannose-6-phosphate isomerase-like protein (cupin superfamily)